MSSTELRRSLPLVILGICLALCLPSTALAKKKDHIATAPMDDGRLQPSWFGEGLAFREGDEIDYLWVKPGFSLSGQTLHFVEWPEPQFLDDDSDRDASDRRLAKEMNLDMAQTFADTLDSEWGGKAQTSTEEGDIKVEGRIVDCSTGSTAAKIFVGYGAGSGSTTIDLKLTDTATGELLVALHHRVVSGTTWSTTDSKFVGWIEELGEDVAKKGFSGIYAKGKPRKD